ncbi:mitochondrial substrate carrier family protein ucpB [Powellomyces hirtus]|nr:mitochondrial substrate carrier family protein ucpB [Powellomyces hirtus]
MPLRRELLTVQSAHDRHVQQTRTPYPWTSGQELAAKLLFAGVGCTVAAFATNPIDVIKTRLQLRGEGVKGAGASSSPHLLQLSRDLVRVEGWRVLAFSGVAPAMLREATYSTIRIGSYDSFKALISRKERSGPGGDPFYVKVIAGLASGMTGAFIANPTDLIKVRMQSPPSVRLYPSVWSAFKSIYTTEGGIPALYRGVGPTTARAGLLTASQLASYDHVKHDLLRTGWFKEGLWTHFCASTFAGLVCAFVTSPVDTVKVRFMNQPVDPVTKQGMLYRSALHCATKTVSTEGFFALYKGFLMCWMRLGPHTTISMIIFERLRAWTGIHPV